MPPDLQPVEFDPFDPARAIVPGFDPMTGMSMLTEPGSVPNWLKGLIGTSDVPRVQTWPERMVRRGLDVAHEAGEGRNPFESVTGVPGAAPAGAQDATYEPNALFKALGMTGRWLAPGEDSGIAKVQDLSGLAVGGPIAAKPGIGTLGSGAMRAGEKFPTVAESRALAQEWAVAAGEHWDRYTPEQQSEWTRRAYDQLIKQEQRRVEDLAKNPPAAPFHSAMEAAVRAAPDNAKMTPEQWSGYLRNRPGVKAEELDWVGLPEGTKLTKQELIDHVQEYGVQVKEVKKSGPNADDLVSDERHDAAVDHLREQFELRHPEVAELGRAARERKFERFGESEEGAAIYDEFINAQFNREGQAPKFSKYQLPDGDNYRELLFTLPTKDHPLGARVDEISDRLRAISELPARETDPNTARGREYLAEHDKLRAEQRELMQQIQKNPSPQEYVSSHWDEPNVLAHVRMNDRDVPGVGKTLHLEELQSDWHQQGRKQGYKTGEGISPEIAEISKRVKGDNRNTDPNYWAPRDLDEAIAAKRITENEAKQIYDWQEHNKPGGVPDAPFKSTWPDLVLKRMIREAAEHGYDAVSWTPGEAQAARYDLSKQISKVEWKHNRDMIGELLAYNHNGRPVISRRVEGANQLPEIIGKEAADRLMSEKADQGNGHRILEGVDLKVGGEGMKAFYDKMLVDKANALGKKFGAKVEWKELQAVPDEYFLTRRGQNHDLTEGNIKIPVLRLTPAMRDTALRRGFPIFSSGVPFPLQPVDHDPFAQEK